MPYVNGQRMNYRRSSVIGGTRSKWGIEEDISWFRACPDTAWNSSSFYTVAVPCLDSLNWYLHTLWLSSLA